MTDVDYRFMYLRVRDELAELQQRKWVGLTDEEIETLAKWADKNAAPWHLEFARAIEAKLKEENI